MKTAQLRQKPYSKVLLMRLLVGLIRFLFDLPAFSFLSSLAKSGPAPKRSPALGASVHRNGVTETRQSMEPSATYIAIQDMIEHGLLGMFFSGFTETLTILEDKGLLTEAERNALLALADNMGGAQLMHSWPPRPGPYFPISGETDSSL